MPGLLDKIERDAAARLTLAPGRPPSLELARYKHFLKVQTHRLKILHRGGGGGRAICHGRAAMMDVLLRYLLQAVEANMPPETRSHPPFALVATGGYGRAELCPFSDIDIMFLHDGGMVHRGKLHPYLAALTGAGGLLYALFDIGQKVGHSTRSIDECVRVANGDMQSKTSLIEARLITGDETLFRKLQAAVEARCVQGNEDAYIAARLEDQEARRTKYGNSATMQEPNIKNGCGGLRDFQNLFWMAFFKYRARSTEELYQRELMSQGEARQLEAAYDFLLRVRNELHYHVNRAVDVLHKSVQPAVAHHLGYTQRSPRERLELFMRDLYRHTRNVYLITRTLEQRLALLKQPARFPSVRELLRRRRQRATQQMVDGFKFIEGQILPASPRLFRDQPRRLMRVFLHAQQRGLTLHPDLIQLVRQNLALVDRSFLADEHVHQTFLEILNQRGNVAPILRAMHEVDFLGKFLPEFGRLTCLVQHEFFHQYAADEHTLQCVEKLDQVWEAAQPPANKYAELFRNVERPFVLYLALLLHDAGKAEASRKHEQVGGQLAQRVAKRLGLDAATTSTLRLIIDSHLLMIQISQRRDLDDPTVIRSFAARMRTTQNLTMLTLHTFADSLGTSEKLWNDFKDSLLWALHRKTLALLDGTHPGARAEEKEREWRMREVATLVPATLSDEEIKAHFDSLAPRYFQIHSAREIAGDLELAHRFMLHQIEPGDRALEPVVTWHNEVDRGYTMVKICTWDRSGLFGKITGSLTAAGLNILSARIFSRTDGIILDTFFVNDAQTGTLVKKEERDCFERILNQVLNQGLELSGVIARRKAPPPLYQSVEGESFPVVVDFDNETSDTHTVIDVEAEDRVGLLYVISQALSELELDIFVAKICTEKGAATDSFYVAEADGSKIRSAERQEQVERRLRAALARLEKL